MLKIRLTRIGKKNKPMYRFTISENAKDPYGKALEILGSYNPYTKDIDIKKERVEHWLSVGAQMSPTVNNLLIEKDIIKGEKVKASKKGKKAEEEEKKDEKPAEASEGEKKEEVAEKTEEKPKEEKKEEAPKEEAKEREEEKK